MSAYDCIFSHGIFGQASYTDSVQWSEGILLCILSESYCIDGMLAIATENEVKVLTPHYVLKDNFYGVRWLRIATTSTTKALPPVKAYCIIPAPLPLCIIG